MATAQAAGGAHRHVVDLVSDDDSQNGEDLPRIVDRPAAERPGEVLWGFDNVLPELGFPDFLPQHDYGESEDEVEITGVRANVDLLETPEPEVPRIHPDDEYDGLRNTQEARDFEVALAMSGEATGFTVDTCLQRVLELFPDVCHDHVTRLYQQHDDNNGYEAIPGPARLDSIIDSLLTDSTYPRQKSVSDLKRKRADSREDADAALLLRWEREDRETAPHFTGGSVKSMLKSEFPTWTQDDIANVFKQKRHYYQSHVHIAGLLDTESATRRGRPSTQYADANTIAVNSGWPSLVDELEAARKRVNIDRKLRLEEVTKKKMEADNLQRAIDAGLTAECQACFDDLPMNRQVHCNGDTAHFTCYECAENYIKSEVGDSRCRVLCTAGCGAGFDPYQLNMLADKKLLERLAQLQQEKDIRDAGLDDLEECPFCDYKAILPPVEEDFEFRCANPDCNKISCRRCKATSHIPMSCEQYANDSKINSRHKIEEAMTAALIRGCNGCKKQFIKEYGCNKMTCPSCGHLQCYVCSTSLKGYEHFDQTGGYPAPGQHQATPAGGKCPLYDDVEARHEHEVKVAEDAARAEVVASNPDVTAEDLQIKMSAAVTKKAAPTGAAAADRAAILAMGMPPEYDDLMVPRHRHRAYERGLARLDGRVAALEARHGAGHRVRGAEAAAAGGEERGINAVADRMVALRAALERNRIPPDMPIAGLDELVEARRARHAMNANQRPHVGWVQPMPGAPPAYNPAPPVRARERRPRENREELERLMERTARQPHLAQMAGILAGAPHNPPGLQRPNVPAVQPLRYEALQPAVVPAEQRPLRAPQLDLLGRQQLEALQAQQQRRLRAGDPQAQAVTQGRAQSARLRAQDLAAQRARNAVQRTQDANQQAQAANAHRLQAANHQFAAADQQARAANLLPQQQQNAPGLFDNPPLLQQPAFGNLALGLQFGPVPGAFHDGVDAAPLRGAPQRADYWGDGLEANWDGFGGADVEDEWLGARLRGRDQ
ncbi:hypothetical protein B0A48_05083 [Cryoendolithus antarcticus]|uniref:RING-type domain-containing protein n=1 Tax=Cryoendolithus antarcticus TaxID=1507870 RepID=A0A1V8TEI8_9PEZI|nr:hypothetical protein B0A48_05083 [Cryoendolithus antarcticus]